jgi:hypothetical protein
MKIHVDAKVCFQRRPYLKSDRVKIWYKCVHTRVEHSR